MTWPASQARLSSLQGGPGRGGAEEQEERSGRTRRGKGRGPPRPGGAHFPPSLPWDPGAGGGERPQPSPSAPAARCPETRPPPPAPAPVPGAARGSVVTSPHPAPKYESAAAGPAPRKGGAGERRWPEGPGRALRPLLPPRGAGRSARGRAPSAAPGSALAHGARRGRGRSVGATAPAGAPRARGGPRGGWLGKPRGRASREARGPVLLGRKAPPRPRLEALFSRAQRTLLGRPRNCRETPPAPTATTRRPDAPTPEAESSGLGRRNSWLIKDHYSPPFFN